MKTPPNKIKLSPTELRRQRPISVDTFDLTLFDTYLRLRFKMICEEPVGDDEKGGWEEVENDYDVRSLKANIACIQKNWCAYNERWKILISTSGVVDDIRFFFNSEQRCNTVFNTIGKWWLGEDWEGAA